MLAKTKATRKKYPAQRHAAAEEPAGSGGMSSSATLALAIESRECFNSDQILAIATYVGQHNKILYGNFSSELTNSKKKKVSLTF